METIDVTPYLPTDHPDYIAWQRAIHVDIARIHAGLSPGHLYVVEFTSGVVKVGRSAQPERRIAEHAALARIHGGDVRRSWASPEHYCTVATERELIEFCTREGRIVVGREYFEIPFATARGRASLLADNQVRPADLPDHLTHAA